MKKYITSIFLIGIVFFNSSQIFASKESSQESQLIIFRNSSIPEHDSQKSHADDIKNASRGIKNFIDTNNQFIGDEKIKLRAIAESGFENAEEMINSSQIKVNSINLFTAISLKDDVIAEIKEKAALKEQQAAQQILDEQEAFLDKLSQYFEQDQKATQAQISLSIKNSAPVKIDENWHDIKKYNPELVQAADQHIAQQPLLKRIGYPTNPYKRTESYCDDLRRKLVMAQSHDITTINPHYHRYQELIQDGNIPQLLQVAIANATTEAKKNELIILHNNLKFLNELTEAELNLYQNELQVIAEQLDSTTEELLLGERIISKLESGQLTQQQLSKFLKHQRQDIEPQDLANYRSCLESYPSLENRK